MKWFVFWRRCRCSHLLIAPGVMTRIVEPECPRHSREETP